MQVTEAIKSILWAANAALAGVIGLTTAWALHEREHKVTIVSGVLRLWKCQPLECRTQAVTVSLETFEPFIALVADPVFSEVIQL
ncbi:hypothetical protein F53441_10459 [Fusarium austroafricanum]|uniref:Uncharacterized protein n=1 Tax=Fusarium austroafricanum TaxID=2364996 RepID=A0A8H4NP71_9HYPO|nr:hypothetical protein F53441_10459 [Fusarium austroafricanum]